MLASVSFRFKLLAALVGLVLLLLSLLLAVVARETDRQVKRAVERAAARSTEAFEELEKLWLRELSRLSLRFTDSTRMPGALEAALEEGEPGVLVEAASYELTLAGMGDSLAVFADAGGRPVVALLGGALVQWSDALPAAAELFERGDQGLSYRVVRGRLFVVDTVPLGLFGRQLGSVMLGTPLDEEAAGRLAEVVGAQVCFTAESGVLVATPGIATAGLEHEVLEVARAGGEQPLKVLAGGQWALLAEHLSAADPAAGMRVVAVPLHDVVAPFARLEATLWVAGAVALLLAVALGVLIARGLSAPVQRLRAATDRVAGGDLDFQVEVSTRDEIGLLAEAFNQMIKGLALKERYRSLLDKVVSREVAEEMLRGEIVLGGENRTVTALFADIRGFTALTEGMEPQQVIALLNEFMDRAAAAIETAGGVVDKYIGDQIMAIFGAPVSGERDALRAVQAAVGIRDAMAKLNRDRAARGEAPIRVGIGVNTGLAVAGNMGSRNRLNYTVLGESVNLASRLCDVAGPGEVLISGATRDAVQGMVEASPLRPMSVKGLSYPVDVFSVQRVLDEGGDDGGVVHRAPAALTVVTALLLAAASSGGVAADEWLYDPPTLAELGAGWRSENGRFQLDLAGRIFVEGYFPDADPAWLIDDTDPFMAGELSLFSDLFLGEQVLVAAEWRLDRGETPTADSWDARVEQLFLRWTPWPGRQHLLQLGRFVSPFGSFPQRHDSTADPFIRPPLSYDYRTMICPALAPGSNDGFIYWRFLPERFRDMGAPVVWNAPYQIGVMAAAGSGRWSGRLALMNGAPSSPPDDWNYVPWEHYRPSWVGHLEYRPVAGLSLGASYNIGPYSETEIEATLPPGASIDDYDQELWGLDISFTRGWSELRGELILDRWEVPNVDEDPEDLSWYLELKQKLSAGFFVAARYSSIHFRTLAETDGEREPWDWDVQRWQLGVGYRLNRRVELRGEMLWNSSDAPAELDPDDDLLSLQLRWEF